MRVYDAAVRPRRNWVTRGLLPGLLLLAVSACSIDPEPVTTDETLQRVMADRAHLAENQEPVKGPISLYEAIARALLYNLDQRVALMEQALQSQQLGLVSLQMLPDLALHGGYSWRSNEDASSSKSYLTGQQSLEPSVSTDRRRETADLGLSWNVLDFGVSYFEAKQQGDRVLIAEERRRKVVSDVVQQVRVAFWQASTAQRLLRRIDPLLGEAQEALDRAKQIEALRLQSPLESLRYRKSLLDIMRQLRGLKSDLLQAKSRLGSLMNLDIGTDFRVSEPDPDEVPIPKIDTPIEKLETLALLYRPELREEDYQKRIGHEEIRKAMLRMLPNLNFTASYNYDSNSYTVNNNWAEAGLRAAWNLVSLISGPKGVDVAEAQITVAETRRLALSMAVLTQVNLAYRQYERSRIDFEYASELEKVERRIYEVVQINEIGNAASQLERIRSATQAIAAELQRDQSLSDLQAALGNIYSSLGLDPLPEDISKDDLATVTDAVRRVAAHWERAEFPPVPTLKEAAAPAGGQSAATPAEDQRAGVPATTQQAAQEPAQPGLFDRILSWHFVD
ncbi:TolC family protein [Tistlia consotensis]|nr:TolC family protein [Tistlia consotensis]